MRLLVDSPLSGVLAKDKNTARKQLEATHRRKKQHKFKAVESMRGVSDGQ